MKKHFFIDLYPFNFQSLKSEKKSPAGTKRKASALMNKPTKDQASKRLKTEVKPKPARHDPIKITIKKSRFILW